MSDFSISLGIVLGLIFSWGTLLFGSVYLVDKNLSCPHFAQSVDLPFKYDFWGGGCFVQSSAGQWVLRENYWNNQTRSQ